MRRPPIPWRDAASGVLAAVAGIAAGHLVAALTDPAASPVLAVGSAVVDATPTPVKEYAVAHLGTNDKPVLLATVTVVTLAAAAVAGVLARRRLRVGVGFLVLLTGLATAAALTRPVTGPLDALPGVVAASTGVVTLRTLLRLGAPATVRPPATGTAGRPATLPDGLPGGLPGGLPATAVPTMHDGRRQFLVGAAAVGLGAVGVAALGQRFAAPAGPGAATLPAATDPAPALPAGLERTVAGVTPLRTGNAAFYRVDTALTVPRVDVGRWTLRVDGDVRAPFTLTYAELRAMPLVERDITMTCVSNEVGGGYVGSARWLGVRVADLLERADVHAGADQLLSTAVDGFTISTPMAVLQDGRDALVAIGMNGQPLPAAHGFPARLVTPGLYGFVGATKWLSRLTATTYASQQAYWTRRGWATDAPIKTASRIDTPRPLSTIRPGRTAIGGVAWAQHRGIARVEVSIDDGPWQDARLGPDVGIDYWRQWWLPWQAASGRHVLRVRATDGMGAVQTPARATPFPNGSSGLQDVVVLVG